MAKTLTANEQLIIDAAAAVDQTFRIKNKSLLNAKTTGGVTSVNIILTPASPQAGEQVQVEVDINNSWGIVEPIYYEIWLLTSIGQTKLDSDTINTGGEIQPTASFEMPNDPAVGIFVYVEVNGVPDQYVTQAIPLINLTSISITPLTASIIVGGTQQFDAVGKYSDGSTADLTQSVNWSSSSSNAPIDSTGLATGQIAGTANISASINGITSNNVSLTVATKPVGNHGTITIESPKGTTITNYIFNEGQIIYIQMTHGVALGTCVATIQWSDNSPASSKTFSLDLLGNGYCQFTMPSEVVSGVISVTEQGTLQTTFNIEVTEGGGGGGTIVTLKLLALPVNAGNVAVSPDGPYLSGGKVTFIATPESGYKFSSWKVNGVVSLVTANSLTITLAGNTIVEADFIVATPANTSWWSKLSKGEQNAIIFGGGAIVVSGIVALIVTTGKKSK